MLPLLLSLLAAASPPSDGTVKLAAPGLSYVQLEDKVGDFYNDYFAQQVVLQGGIRVTTKTEISALLGFERQKELMGCSDKSTSCLAELAGALGVDGLITGSLAKLGSGYTINLKIISATTARPLAVYSARLKGDDALLDWLGERAKELATTLRPTPPPSAKVLTAPSTATAEHRPTSSSDLHAAPSAELLLTTPAAPSGNLRSTAWIPAVAGGAVLIGGVVCQVAARSTAAELRSDGTSVVTFAQLESAVARGRVLEGVGNAAIALGAAGLGTALTLFIMGGDSPTKVSLSSNGVFLYGALP
ncbi:MAG: hypothetical protein ACT4TC_19905 [Myxococcaceae bacterium]